MARAQAATAALVIVAHLLVPTVPCQGATESAAAAATVTAQSVSTTHADGVAPPPLRLTADSRFRIAQVADLHFGEGEDVPWGPQQDANSTAHIRAVVAAEEPSLVVLSGDQLTGLNILSNATAYWDEILAAIGPDTPHTAILGNHDAEPHSGVANQSSPGALTNRTQLMEHDIAAPLSHSQLGPPSLRPAVSVYITDVYGHDQAVTTGAVPKLQLVHLDSGGGGMTEEVYLPQIAWFNQTMAARRRRFGGQVVPALVFIHIPLWEFADALKAGRCFGDHDDGITPTVINNGLFGALEAAPEVHAVFSGHDHCNDFCCSFGSTRAVSLCFGRHTGAGGYACDGYALGTRIIDVSIAPTGAATLDTHVRLVNGTSIHAGPLDVELGAVEPVAPHTIATSGGVAAQVWQTARNTSDRVSRKADVPFAPRNGASRLLQPTTTAGTRPVLHAAVSIDDAVTSQSIVGFGAAFTEASAVALAAVSPALRQSVLEGYFGGGPDSQRYSLCRVHMGSCDYCVSSYSEDDSAEDFALANFSVAHDEASGLLPLIVDALNVSRAAGVPPFRLFASPWSPPAWMKRNGMMNNSLGPVGLKSGDQYQAAWALYFAKFISAYAGRGVNISMVTAQNEPTNWPTSWESCAWDAAAQRDFIKNHLGPTLEAAHPGVDILVLDDNKDLLVKWTDIVYADPEAAKYVAGAGVHWYDGDHFDAVRQTREAHPDKVVIATEACAYPGVVLQEWSRGEWYGHDILGDLANGASGWVDWNMALRVRNCTRESSTDAHPCVSGPNHADPQGDDSPVVADAVLNTITHEISYFYLGHFSRFLPPGSVRVQLNASTPLLEAVAFRTPEGKGMWVGPSKVDGPRVVLIVLNRADVELELGVQWRGLDAQGTVPAHSIQSWVWDSEVARDSGAAL